MTQETAINEMLNHQLADAAKRIAELESLISFVCENVTIEIAAHGDCQCSPPDAPCVYCASISFNERTK